LHWLREKYEIVTGFDIFGHSIDTQKALFNMFALVGKGGKLVIETGGWNCVSGNLADWHYLNLFEYQIFWSQRTFDFMFEEYGFTVIEYRNCRHKGRRSLGIMKYSVMELIVYLARFELFRKSMLVAGKGDPLRFSRPSLVDHAFDVLERTS